MHLDAVAARYARALFDLAKRNNQLDVQLGELVKVDLLFRGNAQLSRALQSPTVPTAVKKLILKRVLEGSVGSTTLNFFYVLVDKGREIYLGAITEAFKELLREERGQIRIVIQSAADLGATTRQQVETRLREYTGKQVELHYEVHPELLGGLVIRLGDRIIDGSVRQQLAQIHERLARAGAAAVGG